MNSLYYYYTKKSIDISGYPGVVFVVKDENELESIIRDNNLTFPPKVNTLVSPPVTDLEKMPVTMDRNLSRYSAAKSAFGGKLFWNLGLEPVAITLDETIPDRVKFNPFIMNMRRVYSRSAEENIQNLAHIVFELTKEKTGGIVTQKFISCVVRATILYSLTKFEVYPSFRTMLLLLQEKEAREELVKFYRTFDAEDYLFEEFEFFKDSFFTLSVNLHKAMRETFATDTFIKATDTDFDFFEKYSHVTTPGWNVFVDYSDEPVSDRNALASFFINELFDFTTWSVGGAHPSVKWKYPYYLVPEKIVGSELIRLPEKIVQPITLVTENHIKSVPKSFRNGLLILGNVSDREDVLKEFSNSNMKYL